MVGEIKCILVIIVNTPKVKSDYNFLFISCMGIRSECLKKVGKRVSVAVVFPMDRSCFPAVGTKHGICSNCEKW